MISWSTASRSSTARPSGSTASSGMPAKKASQSRCAPLMWTSRGRNVPWLGILLVLIGISLLVQTALSQYGVTAGTVLLFAIGSGLGCVFPISTVCMQNAVARQQMGVATGAANFFRALMSALVVAVLGAIVLGRLGGQAKTRPSHVTADATRRQLSTFCGFQPPARQISLPVSGSWPGGPR